MWTSENPILLLFTISGLLTTAFVNAQNSSCQGRPQEFRAVNSTGQHEFTWNSSYASDDPWYVSVLVGPRGTEWNDRYDVRANTYISVPGNVHNGTEICSYQYHNINATLESGGENSCSASYFVDVTNSTCAYTNMPEVQIPDKYSTFGTVAGLALSNTANDHDANTTYDLLTRQAIPLVLLGRFADPESNRVQRSVEFVCMTANKTVEGSRVPEQEASWEGAGDDISARMVGWAAGVVTAVMLVL
ncbi:hypothetical protein BDW02DRAFT_581238 [Decorospora gaudefroyi]|uniref:Uncharacterized protein n=1 Tax=Decorospora gaudefroyi TaxID=184978 RepID=A0A6A5KC16_9PLEO|nr:hypothetical protein BDW02DRAFT_581238 [Decorospora gaudefroyi]